jgi:integrin beta 3
MRQVAELIEHERAATGEALLRISDVMKQLQDRLESLPKPENGKDGKDGEPGKDVDYNFVKSLIDEQVEVKVRQLPPARDGKDGVDGKSASIDYDKVTEVLNGLIGQYFMTYPVKHGQDGKDGAPGKDGISVDPDEIHRIIDGLFTSAHERLSHSYNLLIEKINARLDEVKDGAPGAPGKDGSNVDMDIMGDIIQYSVEKYVKAELSNLIKPVNGKDGRDGVDGKDAVVDWDRVALEINKNVSTYFDVNPVRDGEDGAPGKDGTSVTMEQLAPVVADAVSKAVAGLPKPPHITGSVIDRDGVLNLMYSDGSSVKVGVVVGRDGVSPSLDQIRELVRSAAAELPRPKDGQDGKDGKDGRDGVGFEDIRLEQLDSRNARLVVTNSDGSKSKEYPLTLLGQDYRGMYDETAEYVRGDRVTLGGSEWHCNVPCKGIRPITDCEHWSLAVKRGRDGKQGLPGAPGAPGKDGEKGRDGRDLTQLSFQGDRT